MTANLAEEQKPKTITLGDGKAYELAPLSLAVIADFEKEILAQGMLLGVHDVIGGLNKMGFNSWQSAIYVRLRPNHPELRRDDVGRLITTPELLKISQSIFEEIGLWLNSMNPEKPERPVKRKSSYQSIPDKE